MLVVHLLPQLRIHPFILFYENISGSFKYFSFTHKHNLKLCPQMKKERCWMRKWFLLPGLVCLLKGSGSKCSFPGVWLLQCLSILQSLWVASPDQGFWRALWFSSSIPGYFCSGEPLMRHLEPFRGWTSSKSYQCDTVVPSLPFGGSRPCPL